MWSFQTLAEIRLFAGTFAPQGWAFCNGAVLQIAQNTALFSLIGTTYGGDGRTNFQLPDLRSRVPVGAGRGPGLDNWYLGERYGEEAVTHTVDNLPPHSHMFSQFPTVSNFKIADQAGATHKSGGNYLGKNAIETTNGYTVEMYVKPADATFDDGNELAGFEADPANPGTVLNNGGSTAVENIMPYNTLNYIIAVLGVYPSRP